MYSVGTKIKELSFDTINKINIEDETIKSYKIYYNDKSVITDIVQQKTGDKIGYFVYEEPGLSYIINVGLTLNNHDCGMFKIKVPENTIIKYYV